MFRPALRNVRALPRFKVSSQTPSGRRFASTSTSRSGSWRGAAARWGLAGAAVYYYNTSSVFAEEPHCRYITSRDECKLKAHKRSDAVHAPLETSRESETHLTVDSIAEQRRAQARNNNLPSPTQTSAPSAVAVADGPTESGDGAAALEEEASEQGAFNEETGEINWECPCLGGMAHGPCGEQFRAAFSCFVFSKEEPKGVDCIEHFKNMQNCFRDHPDVYGAEIDDEDIPPPDAIEEESGSVSGEPQPAPAASVANSESAPADRLPVDR